MRCATWKRCAFHKMPGRCWDLIGVLTLPNVVRLKAVADSQMVGFIAGDVRPAEKLAWIATLGVLPEYRGRGIGRRCCRPASSVWMCRRVRLNVRISNQVAIQLYQTSGYRTRRHLAHLLPGR